MSSKLLLLSHLVERINQHRELNSLDPIILKSVNENIVKGSIQSIVKCPCLIVLDLYSVKKYLSLLGNGSDTEF